MTTIAKYQPVADQYTIYRVSSDSETPLIELCALDGWTYLSIPDGVTPTIPTPITTYTVVELTDDLREAIKAASPHAQLIAERVVEQIRAKYPLDEELYFARIAVGALQGTYTLQPGEAEALAQYQVDVEAAREWGRQQRTTLGL